MRLLVSVACADRNASLNLLDGPIDYLDGVDTVAAFVMRGLAEFVARPVQGIERPFHVTLIGAGGLDQRNGGEGDGEDLTTKYGLHKTAVSLRGFRRPRCPR